MAVRTVSASAWALRAARAPSPSGGGSWTVTGGEKASSEITALWKQDVGAQGCGADGSGHAGNSEARGTRRRWTDSC